MNSVRVSLSFAAVIATPGKSFNKSLRNVFPSVTPCLVQVAQVQVVHNDHAGYFLEIQRTPFRRGIWNNKIHSGCRYSLINTGLVYHYNINIL